MWTVDPINRSHPPPSLTVPPKRFVHSINRCSLSSTGNRSCNFSMRSNHLAYAATQGRSSQRSVNFNYCFRRYCSGFLRLQLAYCSFSLITFCSIPVVVDNFPHKAFSKLCYRIFNFATVMVVTRSPTI